MNTEALIQYRISRANETYQEAILLSKENHWNAVANRPYYSCFYIVSALLLKNEMSFSSHNGQKRVFHQSFVKTGKVSIETGRIYSRLFNLRQEGDYIDFKRLEQNEIEPFMSDARHFINDIICVLETD